MSDIEIYILGWLVQKIKYEKDNNTVLTIDKLSDPQSCSLEEVFQYSIATHISDRIIYYE